MKITLKGFDEFDERMRNLGNVAQWARPIMEKAVKYVHSQVPPYPPPPSTSRYRRTGTLGRTITTEVKSLSGNDIAGSIGTKTVYAPDVISTERVGNRGPQKWMHKRTGWWTLQAVVWGQADKIRTIFQAEIRKLLN